jgi:dienelactone hydrolase
MVDLLDAGDIQCAAVAHPSLLAPADLEAVKQAGRPVLFNLAENDEYFTPEMRGVADRVFGQDGRFGRQVWEGTSHGFATRGNVKVDAIRAAKEGAFEASVEWIRKHL